MERPSSVQRCRTCRGDHGEATRSFSKISTPSKPAVAAAASLSSRVPERQTVAIPLRTVVSVADIDGWPFLGRRSGEYFEAAQHPLGVGFGAGEQAEGG